MRPGAVGDLTEASRFYHLTARAEARGTSLSRLVNGMLKEDIELIEAGK